MRRPAGLLPKGGSLGAHDGHSFGIGPPHRAHVARGGARGAAAAIVGAVDYFLPMGFVAQLILFAVLVAALVLIGRRVYESFDKGPGPLPQSRAHAMIGADFFLDEPIARGYGRIRVGDSSWRVAGPDCPAGAMVKVVAVEQGSLLRVERVD
jgi:membrane protein implicated in regulation of membrane protease activity